MAKLTKRAVDAATPKATAYFLWCGELAGFGVRIYPSGRKIFYADYRYRGARKRVALGPHGKLTCEEARKRALSILGDVAKGEDPVTTRRGAITVAALCERYMEAAEQGSPFGKRRLPKRPITLMQDRARIVRHIVPLLGRKLVRELTRADVAKFIRDITIGKTALVGPSGKLRGKVNVRGGAGAATRTVNFLSAVLTFAVHEGIIEHNPAGGVPRQAAKKRTRRLTPDEYRALGALNRATGVWQIDMGIRLLALTGCRCSEIVNLKWSEVDAVGGRLHLAETKEGPSTRPIGKAVQTLLTGLPRRDTPYILWSPRVPGRPFLGLGQAFQRLVQRAGLAGVTPHTLRHSFASIAGDLGYPEAVIAALLGHSGGTVTARYIHPLDITLREAADRVAERINALWDDKEIF
jgi:integrase